MTLQLLVAVVGVSGEVLSSDLEEGAYSQTRSPQPFSILKLWTAFRSQEKDQQIVQTCSLLAYTKSFSVHDLVEKLFFFFLGDFVLAKFSSHL